ncbi:MAG: hypothetical protein GY854_22500 [Deltaproteobacteria bacterium]|nr:hypothetical protein [Deltaproteobacteria bacterium]
MSESELFKCVEDRIRIGPGTPLPQIRTKPHARRSGITARTDFPLESDDHTYVLVVPFTVERRDHYISDLRTGDAQTRIRALYELSHFDDQTARDALQEATKTREVQASLWHSRTDGLVTLTSRDVVEAAKKALEASLHWAP